MKFCEKMGRTASLITVTAVYIIATIVGIFTYRALGFDWWLNLLIADVAATVVTFVFSVIFSNSSVYDPYWSVQPIVIIWCYAFFGKPTLSAVLLLISITLWGIRLTVNWCYTFYGFQYQDWRYVMLKENTGILYPFVNFLGIHLVPTLVVYGCTLPAVYVITSGVQWNIGSVLFFLLSVGATLLQGTADIEMHRFRKAKSSTFIRTGLWKYSRHPNYLGEILMWWGVGLSAVSVLGFEWHLVAGAFANTLLFLFISIPMADKRQSRKQGFAEYKAETRMLLPIRK